MPTPNFNAKQSNIVNRFLKALKQVDGVQAIAIGGSFARGTATSASDIDIGLYYTDDQPFAIADIKALAEEFNDSPDPTVTEFGGWGKWVNGGAWLTIDEQRVDFLYRSVDVLQKWINHSHDGVIELDYYQQPATGFYSYIYLRELEICHPLFDTDNKLAQLKAQIRPYPTKLKQKIQSTSSWFSEFTLYHAESAAKRGDVYMLAGCLLRAMAGVVQIVYANNEQYFLNDKGAMAECMTFEQIPPQFDTRVTQILSNPTMNSVTELQKLLREVLPESDDFQP